MALTGLPQSVRFGDMLTGFIISCENNHSRLFERDAKLTYLSLSINIYQYLSISSNIYQYLSISINIYQHLSTSINIYKYLSISINIYQSMAPECLHSLGMKPCYQSEMIIAQISRFNIMFHHQIWTLLGGCYVFRDIHSYHVKLVMYPIKYLYYHWKINTYPKLSPIYPII